MLRKFLVLLLLAVGSTAYADRIITKGATDQSVDLYIVDNATGLPATGLAYNSSGIDLWYRRSGAAKTSITEVTLAALTTAHADGGFIEIGNGNYRLDLPDAAVASGVDSVLVGGTLTGYTVYPATIQLSAFDLQTAIPTTTPRSEPNVWYLSASGNDSNDGKTATTAKLTPSGVESAATQGDTVIVLPGTIGSTHTFAKDGITWRGVDKQSCIFSQAGSNSRTITVTGDSVTIENLTVTNTGAEGGGSNGPVAVYAGGTHNFTIRRCTTNGQKDSIDVRDSYHATIIGNDVNGTWDAINIGGARNVTVEHNEIACDGTWSDMGAVVSGIAGGTFLGGEAEANLQVHRIRYNDIRVVTSAARVGEIIGINIGGVSDCYGNKIVVVASNASATGAVSGIADSSGSQAATLLAQGNMITTRNAGSGGAMDVRLGHSGSLASLVGTLYDPAKTVGAAVNASPTAAQVNSAVVAGTVGTNASAIKAKTDNLPPSPAATGDIPSAAANATALLGATLTDTGAGKAGRALLYLSQSFASAGKFSAESLEEAPTGGTVIPVNQVPVPESRQWVLEPSSKGLIAPYPKGVAVDDPQVFTIDFKADLPANGRLAGIASVAIVSVDGVAAEEDEEGVTWSLEEPENAGVDKTQGKLRLTGEEPGTYVLQVKATRGVQDGGGTSTGRVTLIVNE